MLCERGGERVDKLGRNTLGRFYRYGWRPEKLEPLGDSTEIGGRRLR
ncbi:hypothetical protein J2Z50_004491 [Ensifer mexicanus]|nr:hypothetical protein [Sinorhizobium mexicanum]